MAQVNDDDGVMRFPCASDMFGTRPLLDSNPLAEVTLHTYGQVGLLATYGSDRLIARAARTSYGKGTKSLSDDRALIRYLIRHRHTSPIEQAELTFYLRLPIFVMRQLIRHRTANVNEYSARYSELSDDFYVPSASDLGKQSLTNKQGRENADFTSEELAVVTNEMVTAQEDCVRAYHRLLDLGVSRELARVPTTVGMYTECYWKIDLHNFLHMLKLRLDPHAQKEIRDFAEAMYACAKPHFLNVFAAFEDYIRNAYTLSALEIQMLSDILNDFNAELRAKGWPANKYDMSAREYGDARRFLDSLITK
jgi:thymidylate synthase (FAD)